MAVERPPNIVQKLWTDFLRLMGSIKGSASNSPTTNNSGSGRSYEVKIQDDNTTDNQSHDGSDSISSIQHTKQSVLHNQHRHLSDLESDLESELLSVVSDSISEVSDIELQETANPLAALQAILVQLQQTMTKDKDGVIELQDNDIAKIYNSIVEIAQQSESNITKEIFQELEKLNLSTGSWEKLLLKTKDSQIQNLNSSFTKLYKDMLYKKQIERQSKIRQDILDTAKQNLGDHNAVLKRIHQYMVSDVTHLLESSKLLSKVLDEIRCTSTQDVAQKEIHENCMLDVNKTDKGYLQHADLSALLSFSSSPSFSENMALLINNIKTWIEYTHVGGSGDSASGIQHVKEPDDMELKQKILAGINKLDLQSCNKEAIAILFHYLADMGRKVLCEGGTIINSFHDEIEKKLRIHHKQLSEVQTPNTGNMPTSSIISPGVAEGNSSHDPSTVLAEQAPAAAFSRRQSTTSLTSSSKRKV